MKLGHFEPFRSELGPQITPFGVVLGPPLPRLRAAPASSSVCDICYQARLLRGYRQKAAACLAIYLSVLPVTVPACIAVMSITYTSHRAQASALVFIWLAALRGAAGIISMCRYVLVLPGYNISGNAPSGQSHLCHPFICGSPASPLPLLSRTPITKYIYS